MSDELSPLDLKFLPDWLKEAPSTNKYANFSGDSGDRPPRAGGFRGGSGDRRGDSRDRGSRPPGPRGNREGGGNRDRDGGSGRPSGDRRGGGPRGKGGHPHGGGPRHGRDQRSPGVDRMAPPPGFKLEFLPEPTAAAHIAKQIRQSSRAYPLFGTARMFLEKPERHQVRVISTDAGRPLYQLENGPVSFDKSLIESSAFRLSKSRFYREESREIEPPKGNFTSVARCRSTGTMLGPTSHHAYPVAIRKLYEERFSRRMSFVEFQREEIEIVSGEQAVADWKSQASKVTVYFTTTEPEPIEFKSLQEVEAHFQKHYLPNLIRSGTNLVCSGRAAREFPDRFLAQAAREAFDRELAYPGSIVHGLRHQFADQNLHVFKHRKRVVYVSAIRPKPADTSYQFAEGPATLLTLISEHPRISRRDLAARILGLQTPPSRLPSPAEASASQPQAEIPSPAPESVDVLQGPGSGPPNALEASGSGDHASGVPVETHVEAVAPVTGDEENAPQEPIAAAPHEGTRRETDPESLPEAATVPNHGASDHAPEPAPEESPELLARKAQLAADLRYLVQTGHVIEFADGKLDLPLKPLPPTQPGKSPDTAENETDEKSELESSEPDPVEEDASQQSRAGEPDDQPSGSGETVSGTDL